MPVQTPSAPHDLRSALEGLRGTGLDETELLAIVERAVADAYRRLVPDDAGVSARVDLASGAVSLYRAGPDGTEEPVAAPADLTRQAAVSARAAVGAWLREVERDRVAREGAARRGELVDTVVERSEGQVWWLRAGDLPVLLPPEEQMPGEALERNQHLKVVILDVRRRARDAVLVASRSHPALLRRLLEQEVPEMASGQVGIRAIAREAGRRSKVAVYATRGDVDPEGACIGPRGVRIRAVVAELGEEQVHVVGWSDDPRVFVAGALAPAAVVAVDLDEEQRTAHVVVPDSQLSLAIGRAGENARLAARLTGWRIDIRGEAAPS